MGSSLGGQKRGGGKGGMGKRKKRKHPWAWLPKNILILHSTNNHSLTEGRKTWFISFSGKGKRQGLEWGTGNYKRGPLRWKSRFSLPLIEAPDPASSLGKEHFANKISMFLPALNTNILCFLPFTLFSLQLLLHSTYLTDCSYLTNMTLKTC